MQQGMAELGISERSVLWFMKNAPKPAEWAQKQKSYGLVDAKTYAEVIGAFSRPGTLRRGNVADIVPQDGRRLQQAVQEFSDGVRKLSDQKALQEACVRFQCLVLYSLAMILEDLGGSKEEVDSVVFWTQPDATQRAFTFKAVRWVHEVIRRLHLSKGWTVEMATQLFFLGKPPT